MSRKLNTNTPYLPTSHAELLINWLVSQSYSQTLLLENTNLSMEELSRCCTLITPTQLRQLILNARRITNDSGLGLKFGEHIGRNAMGILGLACQLLFTIAAVPTTFWIIFIRYSQLPFITSFPTSLVEKYSLKA